MVKGLLKLPEVLEVLVANSAHDKMLCIRVIDAAPENLRLHRLRLL